MLRHRSIFPAVCRARLLYAALPLRVNIKAGRPHRGEPQPAWHTSNQTTGMQRPLQLSVCGLPLPDFIAATPGVDSQVWLCFTLQLDLPVSMSEMPSKGAPAATAFLGHALRVFPHVTIKAGMQSLHLEVRSLLGEACSVRHICSWV